MKKTDSKLGSKRSRHTDNENDEMGRDQPPNKKRAISIPSSPKTGDGTFVYLDEVDPKIVQCVRYATKQNFMGCEVDGYHGKNRVILTLAAAVALAKVHQRVRSNRFTLVVYDGYRPQKAVNHFWRWSREPADCLRKAEYYPRVDKAEVFELGYVAKRSAHSRGSTVDLTLMPVHQAAKGLIFPPKVIPRVFIEPDEQNGSKVITLPFLYDGSVDMGTSFDLMDVASYPDCPFIPASAQKLRKFLCNSMMDEGFRPYEKEWWHFTLINEPHPETHFDFDNL